MWRFIATVCLPFLLSSASVLLPSHAESFTHGLRERDEPLRLAQASRPTEKRLRKVIGELQGGSPNYEDMEPALRVAVRQQLPMVTPRLKGLGPVKSIRFEGEQQGSDVYDVQFERGGTVWMIGIAPSGKLAALWFQ